MPVGESSTGINKQKNNGEKRRAFRIIGGSGNFLNRLFTYSSLSALINYTATFAIVFFLSLYLQKIQGLSPRDAGAVIVAQPLMMTLFSSPNMNTIMSSVKQPQYGQASGIAASMRVFGQIFSMSIITFLFSMNFGESSVDAVPDGVFMQVMQWGFLIFAMIGVPGIYFSFNRGDVKK